ncbi:MAG TPA: D-lysine 5,6-aminomutase subunit alpha [Chloroflexi bacterium]|nr:D-lysine 5,6-aminomutase subunit alpha [Chloroflexota bacterium]
MAHLRLDNSLIERARRAAATVAADVVAFIEPRTTISVERAVLRLLGVDGVNRRDVPLPNVVVDQLRRERLLGRGAAFWVGSAMVAGLGDSPQAVAEAVAEHMPPGSWHTLAADPVAVERALAPFITAGWARVDAARDACDALVDELGESPPPWLYVIVASGNIFEDVSQARTAVAAGADVIAVIRSTAQSLLDYIPYGTTTEGFGGTFATQANFALMRAALDEESHRAGRYVRLTNYASGLCMPEITVAAALERLDMLLNDAKYGIIFRDINMQRTLIDQQFSRRIVARANIIINTGEDNYLTTADAYEQAHTVIASQMINQALARLAGMADEQMGLGHAFEMNPALPDGFLWEVAQAQLVRELFPTCPIKYMPPTRYMTGNIFQGHVQDTLFNVASVLTRQSIHLVGILTEALHTPLMQDRYLSLKAASYVKNNMAHLGEEIEFRPGGRIERRANETLRAATEMLEEIAAIGLFAAIERAMFADIARSREGGKGLEGVLLKGPEYWNPFGVMEGLKVRKVEGW